MTVLISFAQKRPLGRGVMNGRSNGERAGYSPSATFDAGMRGLDILKRLRKRTVITGILCQKNSFKTFPQFCLRISVLSFREYQPGLSPSQCQPCRYRHVLSVTLVLVVVHARSAQGGIYLLGCTGRVYTGCTPLSYPPRGIAGTQASLQPQLKDLKPKRVSA